MSEDTKEVAEESLVNGLQEVAPGRWEYKPEGFDGDTSHFQIFSEGLQALQEKYPSQKFLDAQAEIARLEKERSRAEIDAAIAEWMQERNSNA